MAKKKIDKTAVQKAREGLQQAQQAYESKKNVESYRAKQKAQRELAAAEKGL